MAIDLNLNGAAATVAFHKTLNDLYTKHIDLLVENNNIDKLYQKATKLIPRLHKLLENQEPATQTEKFLYLQNLSSELDIFINMFKEVKDFINENGFSDKTLDSFCRDRTGRDTHYARCKRIQGVSPEDVAISADSIIDSIKQHKAN